MKLNKGFVTIWAWYLLVPSTGLASSVTVDIVCKIHDSISVEYLAKYSAFEKILSGLKKQIASLEDRIEVIELQLDDMDQKTIMDTLIFSGLKQAQGASVEMSVTQVMREKMGLPDIANSHILSVRRFQNPSNPVSNSSNVSPVCVVFRNLDAAKTVFMAKSKLAKTGIFVSEYFEKA